MEFFKFYKEETIQEKINPEYKAIKEGEIIDLEKDKRKIIVEVGCGSRPYFTKINEEITEKEHYIGLDLPEKYIVEPKDEQERLDIPKQESYFEIEKLNEGISKYKNLIKGKADFIIASGLHIPLKKGVADKVVFNGVLGAPPVFFKGSGFVKNQEEFSMLWKRPFVQEYIAQLNLEERELLDKEKEKYESDIVESGSCVFSELAGYIEDKIQRADQNRYKHMLKWENLFTQDAKERLIEEAVRSLKDGGELNIYDWERELGYKFSINIQEIAKKFTNLNFIREVLIEQIHDDKNFMAIFKKSETDSIHSELK